MEELRQEITDAKRIVFLTGAGVSTASGIPDYRSKNGLYSGQQNPEYLLSAENLRDHPQDFFDFVTKNMFFPEARPNLIHTKMAEISNEKGIVITQNVDGLDKQAGNHHVIEFHGNLYNLYCQVCHQNFTYPEYKKSFIHEQDGGIIRPGITLYSEQIDPNRLENSVKAISQADLIIIVGTSFRVYPFAQLLEYRNPNTKVWAINKEQISNDPTIKMLVADARNVFAEL